MLPKQLEVRAHGDSTRVAQHRQLETIVLDGARRLVYAIPEVGMVLHPHSVVALARDVSRLADATLVVPTAITVHGELVLSYRGQPDSHSAGGHCRVGGKGKGKRALELSIFKGKHTRRTNRECTFCQARTAASIYTVLLFPVHSERPNERYSSAVPSPESYVKRNAYGHYSTTQTSYLVVALLPVLHAPETKVDITGTCCLTQLRAVTVFYSHDIIAV